MTRKIRYFSVHGKAIDVETVYRLKATIVDMLVADMRNKGYVPTLDHKPDCITGYNERQETFDYEIKVGGIYVGPRRSREIYCVRNGVFIYPRVDDGI